MINDPTDPPPWVDEQIPDTFQKMAPKGTTTAVRPGDQLHTISGYIMRQTEKAILIEVRQVDGSDLPEPEDVADCQHWFPLSQVSTIHQGKTADGEYDYIRAKEWICKNKDLI